MKKHADLIKRIAAMALSVVMVISLFPNGALKAFAEEIINATTPVLDFVPQDSEAVAEQMDYDVVYIKNNELTVYEHYTYGVNGEKYTGAQGEQIELSDSYTYTVGEEQIVLYRYYALEDDGVMKTAQLDGYAYISASDVSFEVVEKPTATPTPDDSSSSEDTSSSEETSSSESTDDSSSSEDTSSSESTGDSSSSEDTSSSEEDNGIKLDFIPEGEVAENTTPTEKYAVITTDAIKLYKTLDYGAQGIEMTVAQGTVIEVVTAYTFSNGQVLYHFDYNGAENSALYNAALSELSGYQFIPAEYITLGVETVENTTITDPDTSVSVTGVLPTTAELDTVPTAISGLPEGTDTTGISEDALFYDFTLANGGAYFEPSGTVKVTFPQQNITFAQGTEYTIYHVTDDGVVTTLGTGTYDGEDIKIDVDSFSYIGLSADTKVEFEDVTTFTAQFATNPVTIYADTALENSLEFEVDDTDIFTISMKVIITDADDNVTELYVIDENSYEGTKTDLAEAISPTDLSLKRYAYVYPSDVKQYVKPDPTPTPTPTPTPAPEEPEQSEEVLNAYENLIKAPTAADFEKAVSDCIDNGYADYFTEEQMAEIDRIGTVLEEMVASTEDMTDFSFEGTVSVEGAKLYLNPVTWPDEYVTIGSIIALDESDSEYIEAEYATVEGEYTADNGDVYYIIDTSSWAAFAGKIPYKYIGKDNFTFDADWTKVNGKGYFLSDEISIYDNTGRTYRIINNGLSKGVFDILYSFNTSNGDGTVTKWYIINTTGWTDVNGSTFKNRLVKQSDANLITAEQIAQVYNNIITASAIEQFNTLYADAQLKGFVDCFTAEQTANIASVKATLEAMAEDTVDLSAYDMQGSFANEETKLYPNPVTNPDEYITAVVEPQTNLLGNLLSTFNLFLTVYADDGDQVTAQEVKIVGKYLDGETLYYIIDVSAWEGLPAGVETLYVKASEIEIYVDQATQQTYMELLSAQTKEEFDSLANTLDEKTLAVMTEAGLKDVTDNYAEVLEYVEANGSEVIADETAVGMYAQPIDGLASVYLYANPSGMTDGMTYYNLPSEEFKSPFKITEVFVDRDTVYYKMNYTYPAKDGTDDCSWIRADSVEILEDFITEQEKLYLSFIQTETLEEWFAIEESLTETQQQALEALEDAEKEELRNHFDSLPSAIDKAKTDSFDAMMNATTVAQYAELFASLTDEVKVLLSGSDYIALHDHAMELLKAEDTTPQDVVEYLNTAPLVIPDFSFEQVATFNMMRSNSLATFLAAEETPIVNADGVVTTKDVTLKDAVNGIYTVNLETYVTGSKVTTKVESQIPTDIIIVVDQSGSMEFDMNKTTTYDRINATALDVFNSTEYMNNTYVNVGTAEVPVYKKVTITAETNEAYVLASSLGYRTNSTLYNHSDDLYYKETESSTPVKVTVKRTTSNMRYRYSYSIPSGELTNTNTNGSDYSPSFLDRLYIKTDTVTKVKFTYRDANDNEVVKEYLPTDSVPKDTDNIVGNTYYYRNTATTEYRLDALVRALNNFAASVEEKAKGADGVWGINPATNESDDVNHRIAIVGFSSNGYDNTEILTGCTITNGDSHSNEYGVYYPYGSERNGVAYDGTGYAAATRTALVDMNTTAGQTSVENAIKALTAHGGTQTDHGMDMALDIWAAEQDKNTVYTKVEDGKTVTVRNKVVILFTDGEPTGSGNSFSNEVANNAIGYSKTIKNTYNATVYGIGIFDGADARVLTNTDKTNAYLPSDLEEENEFMHFVSSNFKNAESMNTQYDTNNGTLYNTETFHKDITTNLYTGKSYYLSASNSEALNNIFQTISSEVEEAGKVVELNEETVIKDIVAPNFSVPANASNVTVKLDDMDTQKGTFKNSPYDPTGVTATIEGTNVNVTGFDFAENWVGTETAADGTVTYRGTKLIITFDIPVDPDFMGGNKVKTNGDASGVYDDAGDLVENFVRPTVDIALKNIDVAWQNQHIYRTNDAYIEDLFMAATVNGKSAGTVINGENNAYVDIVFTITDSKGNAVATYTIDAGETFAQGGWNGDVDRTPALTADEQYTLSWTVTPIYEGEAKAVGGSATANVYVYNPTLTYKDGTGHYGAQVPTYGDVNLVNTVWKHGTTLSTDNSITMHGTEPTLTKTYEFISGVTDNVITTKSDVPVNVTKVAVGTTDITEFVTFEHQPCKDGETIAENAEFVLHIETATLTISKTVVANNTAVPDDTFTFTVTQTVDNAFGDGFKPAYYYDVYEVGKTDPVYTNLAVFAGDANIKLKHNQYAVLTGFPMGTYTVTEATTNGKYKTTSEGATDTFSTTKLAATAAFTNELNTGSLTVNKTVVMPTGFAQTGEEFAFEVRQGTTVVASFSLTNGTSKTIDNLVQGDYTVVELLTNAQKELYTADKESQNVTVEAGKTATADVTNTAKTGSLSVKKTVVDNAVNYDSTKDTFTITVHIDGYADGTIPYKLNGSDATATITGGNVTLILAHDDVAVFSELLVGKAYTVSETENVAYRTPVITNSAGTIVANGTKQSVVTNTVKTGKLVVDKVIELPAGIKVADDEVFKFTVTGPEYNETVSITKDGQTTIENLFVGEYTVVENLDADQQKIYTTTYVAENGKATVADGGEAKVTVTNTVTAGKLDVTKEVVDVAENIDADKKYTMEITLTGDIIVEKLIGTVAGTAANVTVTDGKATVELANGETAQFTNIPVGATYTVTETGVDTNYYTVTYENKTGTVAADTPLVKVTNTRKYGKLTITKAAGENTTFDAGETFIFTVKDKDGKVVSEVVIAGEGSITINNLPLGEYTVTEDLGWAYKYTTTKYTPTPATNPDLDVKIVEDLDATITFTNTEKTDQWLKSYAYAENIFADATKGGSVTTVKNPDNSTN